MPHAYNSPHFPRAKLLGQVKLLRTAVDLWTATPQCPLNMPHLYEIAAVDCARNLIVVYVGQAFSGVGRPVEAYGQVLECLHANRKNGIRLGSLPNTPYIKSVGREWSFRWIHHELERLLAAMPAKSYEFSICIQAESSVGSRQKLKEREDSEIVLFKKTFGSACANDCESMPKAAAAGKTLDTCW